MNEACREILVRLETYLDHECPPHMQAAVEEHLESCPPCLRQADFRHQLRVLIATRCRDTAPRGLLERVRDSLSDFGGA